MQQVEHDIFNAASSVYSQPVEAHGRTIITASEVFVAGGFGGGSDQEGQEAGEGYGGGGTSNARPVAAIIVEEGGVRVEPIFDASKVLMTLITALFGMLVAWSRVINASRREET
jgi:uncharacterized spore protein YtfJ